MSLQQELKRKRPFESLQQEAIMSIWRTNDLYMFQVSRLLHSHGLTPSQYSILRILWDEGDPLPILEIANRTISVVAGITGLIDRLEKEGFVTRERSAKDRRVIYVTLTEKGQTIVLAVNKPLNEFRKKTIGHLTQAELKELIRLLGKTRESLLATQKED